MKITTLDQALEAVAAVSDYIASVNTADLTSDVYDDYYPLWDHLDDTTKEAEELKDEIEQLPSQEERDAEREEEGSSKDEEA